MTSAVHREIQRKLLAIGEALGYRSRRSFKKHAMGDAVWLDGRSKRYAQEMVPVAAFEILSFETKKEMVDCIMTLQSISPALGVLVVLEEEYARLAEGLITYDAKSYPAYIRAMAEELSRGIALISRIEVWDQAKVERLYVEHVEGRLRL
ncbi:MAG: hypothetical protein V1800_01690 [Candidatus Latescibacterota bacterium]